MFTGIIKSIGDIQHIGKGKGIFRAIIDPNLRRRWAIGESVSVSGVCSTIITKKRLYFLVEYMPQTVKLTTVGSWKKNDKVNIEPSLKIGGELSGHIVQGHVDGRAEIIDIKKNNGQYALTCAFHHSLTRYIAQRGSIALDGVSLTVGKVRNNTITVFLTPFTYMHTTFQYKKKGDALNLEVDMLAKYTVGGFCKKIKQP